MWIIVLGLVVGFFVFFVLMGIMVVLVVGVGVVNSMYVIRKMFLWFYLRVVFESSWEIKYSNIRVLIVYDEISGMLVLGEN